MLLSTLVKTVKRKSHRGNQSVTTDQITADIIACVNEAARDVQKLLPKRFWLKQSTLNLVLGTQGVPAVYSLPSDCQDLSIAQYTVNNVYYLVRKVESDIEWFSAIWNPVMGINRPYYFRELGPDGSGNKQIELFPIPNQSITLNIEYYRLKSADLGVGDLGNQIPDIPDQYQDVLEKGAYYYFLKGFDDPAKAEAKQDYEEAKMALEIGDERDSAGRLQIRLRGPSFELPGFRLYP